MPIPPLALDVGVPLGGDASSNGGPEDTTLAGPSANASTAASLTLSDSGAEVDELDQVVVLIKASELTENRLSGLSDIDGTVLWAKRKGPVQRTGP